MRRLGGVLYEALTVATLLLLASAIVTAAFGSATAGTARLLLQAFAFLVVSAYFLWCWTHGGQTLAMRTWRMRVVDAQGRPLTFPLALRRYLLACLGLLLGGAGLWWALLDKEGLFLHDRLAHTRLAMREPA